jgi:hypothetical protein
MHTRLNDKNIMLLLALCLCFYNKKKLASIHMVGLFDKKLTHQMGINVIKHLSNEKWIA